MKRKLLIWAVLLLLVLVVGCDGKKGGLSVKVYEGETSEFLKVNLKLTIGGKTASTSSGQYTFTQVPVGTHTLTVEAAGYFEKNQEVTIEAGKVVDCEVRLVKNYIAEVKVPGGINPIGLKDNYLITPIDSFFIAKYEISWQAWKEVYDWATDDARLGRKYYFENEGKMGEVFSGGVPPLPRMKTTRSHIFPGMMPSFGAMP